MPWMLWPFVPWGIKICFKYPCSSRYCIEGKNSSILTTLHSILWHSETRFYSSRWISLRFTLHCKNCEMNSRNMLFMQKINLPGMCSCMHLTGQHSITSDNFSYQSSKSWARLFNFLARWLYVFVCLLFWLEPPVFAATTLCQTGLIKMSEKAVVFRCRALYFMSILTMQMSYFPL